VAPDEPKVRNIVDGFGWGTHVVVLYNSSGIDGGYPGYTTRNAKGPFRKFGTSHPKANVRTSNGVAEYTCPWECYQILIRRPVRPDAPPPASCRGGAIQPPAAPPTPMCGDRSVPTLSWEVVYSVRPNERIEKGYAIQIGYDSTETSTTSTTTSSTTSGRQLQNYLEMAKTGLEIAKILKSLGAGNWFSADQGAVPEAVSEDLKSLEDVVEESTQEEIYRRFSYSRTMASEIIGPPEHADEQCGCNVGTTLIKRQLVATCNGKLKLPWFKDCTLFTMTRFDAEAKRFTQESQPEVCQEPIKDFAAPWIVNEPLAAQHHMPMALLPCAAVIFFVGTLLKAKKARPLLV